MSSSQNASHVQEENNSADLKEKEKFSNLPEICTQKSISSHDLILCPDTHENPSASHSEVENLNKSPLNEESGHNDETFVSNMEESLGGKRDMSIEPNNANNDLELRHDDDFDDGNDIVNEDALLNEDEDLKDDIIKVQEEKDIMEIQNQDISLEEVEKNAKTIDIKDKKDIPGETQKMYKDGDEHNDQNPLINVTKEPENQSDEFLVKEECCEDFIAVDEIKEEDKHITNESKISTISHNSSFEQITEHGLNKPDMMLEIPTQEFIEFSDEDDELGETSVQKSHDVEVIDLEKNCCIDNNLVNMDEKEIEDTKNKSSVDTDMTVLADHKANINTSQAIVESSESCEDVNMEVSDCQNDITTNALSYEAEIAADIITKEMNNVNVETVTQETEVIKTENENSTEELINSLKSEADKEVILVEAPDADIIVLSDDNIEIELEDSESSSAESLPDQNMKIQNSIKTVELDEDILNDTEEIDNLLLSRKLSKTTINEDNVKESDHLDKSCTKPFEKSISEQNTVVNISEATNRLEISCQSANKTDTEPDKKVASETSSNMPINPAAKILDNINSDELTKQEGTAHDVSYKSAVTPDKMQITTPEIKVSQACISRNASPQLDSQFVSKIDFKLPQEIPSEQNMASIRLLGYSENKSEQSSASEEESQVSKTPELVKSTTERTVSMIDDLMSSPSNIDISKINENKSEIELSTDALKSSSTKLAGLTVKPFTSKDNKEYISNKGELMEVDIIEQLKHIKETETSETREIELSTSNIEPKMSEIVEPQISTSKIVSETSEIIEPQLKLKAKLNAPEIDQQQQSASKVELLTLEKDGPSLSTSKIEQQASEMDGLQKSTSKIAPKTLESIEQEPPTSKITSEIVETTPSTSIIEPKTSEVVEPISSTSNIKPATSEIVESTPSTSKNEPTTSETVVSTPSTSKIEPTIAVTVDPKVPTSNIELTTLEADESQQSSSKIVPKTQEPIKPQPSTSNIESETPESSEPQPSTSKCDAEALNSKPSSPKNQSAFDSLGQDSSNDVPEMTDSLGLLAESSRVMEDDEEHDEDEDDEDDDDGDRDDDDDDFEPDDESSNQMSAENSEDSNTQHSDMDVLKDDFEISESIDIKEEEPEKLVCDADEVKIEESNIKTKKTINNEALDNKDSVANAIEIDTVKLSDTSDTEDNENKKGGSVLKSLLTNNTAKKSTNSDFIAKTKKLSITKQDSVVSYVDLEESSSDDDKTQPQTKATTVETKGSQQGTVADASPTDVPQIETPKLVKETSSSKSPQPALEDVVKHKEPQVVAKSKLPSKAVVPDSRPPETKARSPLGLEVFSLDSDEEDSCVPQQTTDDAAVTKEPQIDKPTVTKAVNKEPRTYKRTVTPAVTKEPQTDKSTVITIVTKEPGTEKPTVTTAVTKEPRKDQPKPRRSIKCINRSCANNDPSAGYYVADTSTAMYFEADKISKRAYVCKKCSDTVEKRNQELVEGMKDLKPLFRLHTARNPEELVEISDSDSDEEPEPSPDQMQFVGNDGARMLEEKLADMINETWEKFKMDDRIVEAQTEFQKEIERMQKEGAKIEAMFNECQAETDRLRNSLYAAFDPQIQELPAVIIYDMPNCSYSCLEPPTNERVQSKRRLSPSKDSLETRAKKPAMSTPVPALPDTATKVVQEATPVVEKVDDDNMDISVVTLAAEAAPADLPPPGELSHPPVKLGMTVYAMKNAFGTWLRAKVVEIMPKAHNMPFTMVRVRFEHKVTKNPFKTLPARCLAYFEPSEVRMTIGTRVIALFKDISSRQAFYSGIVAEIPNPVNNYRYLIFFDDGYAQYAPHAQTRLVCECSALVWEEVHPYSREFVRGYLLAYPERPMVRLHAGQSLKTEWRGKWWSSRVVSVDSSLVEVQFLRCDRREWIYRGSTRLAPLYLELQAAERHRPRALPRAGPQARTNMPYVEYTRSDEQANKQRQQQLQQQQIEEIRRQRAVAKKSTSVPPPPQHNTANLDHVTSRVVYYTPKNAVKPYKITPHTCSPKCKRTDVLALKDLRTYNPLAKPLLSGWERQIVRFKGHKEVMYVAPCGRRLRDVRELHRYLRAVDSDMPVDLFDFSPTTHCLAEFVLNKCFVGKKDLSHGKEIVPVPCVNYYDESLPEFCSYNTERTPTAGVPLNLDPEFLCGCDCDDDCEDKSKCACWKMTLEGARTIGYEGDVGYVYRRLPEPLPSGIYECNSRCKCKNTCLNRVAQHPLQLKLQVFKTHNRGWGIRALNDVPKGAFLCIYAGNLLTDATANLDGLNEGDEYLAELDYIEVVEQMKEGFEEDIPDKIKAKDKKELAKQAAGNDEEDDETSSSSEEETVVNKTEREDGDFEPGYIRHGLAEFSKRLRKRKKEAEDAKQQESIKKEADDECITISDDEEVREPSCFTAAAGMGKNQFISKYRSVRTLFGEDEACYIMDAKVQGNIGRYLNHSCTPNVFVQNVFVDTHDPRFPWVAFFALHHIRAGTELTWNYNYDVGSVPGKVLYCFCGAPNCRGRLL